VPATGTLSRYDIEHFLPVLDLLVIGRKETRKAEFPVESIPSGPAGIEASEQPA
jgi:hypothetical protein